MTVKKNVGRYQPRHRQNAKKCCEENRLRPGLKNPDFHRLRPRQKCLKISDLVYKFLENVATSNDAKRQKNNARSNFQRTHVRKYSRQSRRPDDPKITDQLLLQARCHIQKKSHLNFDSPDSPFVEKKRIKENHDAMEILEKKSSSQFVKDYVKSVNQSKRRAERYICKALSFGVDAGFLVSSADSAGHVLRVSSALDVKILRQNMGWGKETQAGYRENKKERSCRRDKRQNPKSDDSASCSRLTKKRSKSMSEKSKSERHKSNSRKKKRTFSPGPAEKRLRKSNEKARSKRSEDDD